MSFGGTGQDGEPIIFSSIYKKYWEIGFKTRLYDGLSPEAYLESLQRAAAFIEIDGNDWVLDAGCGSGLLLSCLENQFSNGARYVGTDVLSTSLTCLKTKMERWSTKPSVSGVQADFSGGLPLRDRSVSSVVAHFSVYTLSEEKSRRQAFQEFARVLKAGGRLVTSNPTHNYDAGRIIRSSLELLQSRGKPWIIKKFVLYPLALYLGLRHIERQLKSGKWHAYLPEQLRDEVAQAGFSIEHSETVYGESGLLLVGKKL